MLLYTVVHEHGVFILGPVNFWETFATNISSLGTRTGLQLAIPDFLIGIICGLIWGSFPVRDHLPSNLGIICGPGSFAVLGSFADPYTPPLLSGTDVRDLIRKKS